MAHFNRNIAKHEEWRREFKKILNTNFGGDGLKIQLVSFNIDEEIKHCEKICKEFHSLQRIHQAHAHLKEWLEELKEYRATNLNPKQISEIDEMYSAKCREVHELRTELLRRTEGGVDG